MAYTQEYIDWLKEQSAFRVLLVEMDGWNMSTDQAETFPMSTHSANDYQHYYPIVTKTPILQRSVSRTLKSSLQPSAGFIEVDISDGRFDGLIYNSFDGRNIIMRHGDASWQLSQFQTIYSGKITKFDIVSDTVLRIDFSNGESMLDRMLSDIQITTAGNAFGAISPVSYGHVRNITPILIDKTARRYKLHDSDIASVDEVYADGAPVGYTTTSADLAKGEFTLNADQSGTITCDAMGSWIVKAGSIIQDMLTRYGHMDIADIDTQSIIDYDAGSPNVGVYFKSQINLLVAMQRLVDSHIGWFDIGRDGKFNLHKFAALSTESTAGESTWQSLDKLKTPGSGEFSFDANDSTKLLIHEVDDTGANRSSGFDQLVPHDDIYIQESGDTNRWKEYRIHSITDTGSVRSLDVEVLAQGSGSLRKNNQYIIRLTHYETSGDVPAPSVFINDHNIVGGINLKHDIMPVTPSIIVAYNRCWTVQQLTGNENGVSESHAEFVKNEYRHSTFLDPDEALILQRHMGAKTPPPLKTLITDSADAAVEAELRQALGRQQRYWLAPRVLLQGLTVELGDMAEITSSRFGLYKQQFRILHIEDDLVNAVTTVSGWF